MRVILCTLAITIFYNCNAELNIKPVVSTALGEIQGELGQSLGGRTIYKFEGVPYAQPPIGNLRFKEPQPVNKWDGRWIANNNYLCMQFNMSNIPGNVEILGDEDCLYLSIYTPDIHEGAQLDVIVYIHGGGFMFTHGGYLGPEILLDHNVVYVKFNYRLGPLGFLSLEDNILPGNNGLKDQSLALQWLNDHIHNFGGNPNSITITGMSAGGASVHYHYMIPKSRNLFAKGHSMSGCALSIWALTEANRERAKKLASHVGCNTSQPSEELVKCLQRRPARQIVDTVKYFQVWLYNPFTPFGPVVDAAWADQPIFAKHPFQLLKNGEIANVPWLASWTGSEGLFPIADFYIDEHLDYINTKWNYIIPHLLDYNYTVDRALLDTVSKQIRTEYFGDKNLNKDTYDILIEMAGDRLFVADIIKASKLQAALHQAPVYNYYFTYRGSHSQSEYRTRTNIDFGASHGDDTSYMLKIDLDMLHSESDKKISNILVNMLVSYANTSIPKIDTVLDDWKAINDEPDFNYLHISSPTDIQMKNISLGRQDFWNSLPFQENDKI